MTWEVNKTTSNKRSEKRRFDEMRWDEVTKRVQINIYNEVVKVNKKWIIK